MKKLIMILFAVILLTACESRSARHMRVTNNEIKVVNPEKVKILDGITGSSVDGHYYYRYKSSFGFVNSILFKIIVNGWYDCI